ncbi:CatB-related O-acetyltransferase [Rhodococcus sp. G-MC3]|uniref:CatB-related O-acetyltransferase n=1 Tax=Rhodococcus sp. G-MC3 TaxID=3046209 RepID=UPI0024BAF124|nr:CatB-related O-acetyltransferase [Rhodococcus sp. G-MC3]MDJ0396360.1 CatB-related O-acetyltransferase [Rhodococcus sp. G-MC3]
MMRGISSKYLPYQSVFGRLIERLYEKLPLRSKLLQLVVGMEGGQMYSATLRRILSRYFGVEVGNYSYGSLLQPGNADRLTEIGRYVSIGPGVRRIGAAHPLTDISMHPFWYNAALGFVDSSADVYRSKCSVGHDSWIGANVVILPGCTSIGIGAVVGAGSVVTRDVPAFTIVAGNPARIVRSRFDSQIVDRVLASNYWELEPASAQQLLASLATSGETSKG